MAKIKVEIPIVELDGDEMTRIIWAMIKERLVLPFLDADLKYYDLGIRKRDETDDKITAEAGQAIKRYGVGVKCATITPDAERVAEYGLKKEWPSPNGQIRSILDGTVFRKPIIVRNISPAVRSWKKPIIIGRHAYGDIYQGVEIKVDRPGKVELVYTPTDGPESRVLVHEFKGPGVVMGIHNLEKSIRSFARSCIHYALSERIDLWFSMKDTISKILHGEQEIIFHHPIPPEGTLTTEGAITHYYDRGKDKGAFIVGEFETRHSNGQKLYTSIATVLARLDGGFGGENPPKEEARFPERAPDIVVPDTPAADQPLFFRLSGDIFPLHVDAEFARMAGFDKPIMHGLCTHGFACRAVIKSLFPGEPERMTRFKVRFSRPLYPGVPIKTQIWKVEEGKAFFRTLNAETGEVVMDRGIVEWMSKGQAAQREKRQGIRFDGRVAIVTGAGGGLGRAYALSVRRTMCSGRDIAASCCRM